MKRMHNTHAFHVWCIECIDTNISRASNQNVWSSVTNYYSLFGQMERNDSPVGTALSKILCEIILFLFLYTEMDIQIPHILMTCQKH